MEEFGPRSDWWLPVMNQLLILLPTKPEEHRVLVTADLPGALVWLAGEEQREKYKALRGSLISINSEKL